MGAPIQTAEAWRTLFENWPDAIPRQGIVVTPQETIPFVNYLISGSLVILERDKPDTLGARKVIVAYDNIVGLKLPSPLELAKFQVMGFQQRF